MSLPGQGLLYEKLKELWDKYKERKEEKAQKEQQKEEKTLVTQPEWRKLDKEQKEIKSMDRESLEKLTMNALSTVKDMKKSQSNLQSRVKQLESEKKEEQERKNREEIIEEKLEEAEQRQQERTEQIKELRVHDQKLGMRELPKWLLASDHELPNYKYFYGWREEEKENGEVKRIPLVTDNKYGKKEPKTLRNIEVDDEEEIFESKAGIIGQYKSGIIHTLIALDSEGEPLLLGQGVPDNNGGKQRKQQSQGNNGGNNNHIVNARKLQSNKVSQNQNKMGQQMSNREMQLQKAIQQLRQQSDKYKEEYQKAKQREQQLQEQVETLKMQLENTDEQRQHWAGAAADVFENQTQNVKEVAKVMGSLQDQVLNRLLAQGQAKTLSNALQDMKADMEEMLPEEKHDLVMKKVIDEVNELQGGEGGGGGMDPTAIKQAVSQGYKEAFQEVMQAQQQQQEGGGGALG